jgi:hypothetical protein
VEALHNFDQGNDKVARLSEAEALPYPELLLKLRVDWQRRDITQ